MRFVCEYCEKEVEFFPFPVRYKIKCPNCGNKNEFVKTPKMRFWTFISASLISYLGLNFGRATRMFIKNNMEPLNFIVKIFVILLLVVLIEVIKAWILYRKH